MAIDRLVAHQADLGASGAFLSIMDERKPAAALLCGAPQQALLVARELLEAQVQGLQSAVLREYAQQALDGLAQGSLSFKQLQGGPLAALAELQWRREDGGVECVVLPASALSRETLSCLVEVSTSSQLAQEPRPTPETTDALLAEMAAEMDSRHLHAAFEALLQYRESSLSVGSIVGTMLQLAQLDGPLRMLGGPPVLCDLQTFNQHLGAITRELNTLHEPQMLGEYLHSAHFTRDKFELFALQHLQLLVWVQRVEQSALQGYAMSGAELQRFVSQISHAARCMVSQPMLLHSVQVMRYVHALPSEPVAGSMRQAMVYPDEKASDADRVEYLQLNLLLQFQNLYKTALCEMSIYQPHFSPGEESLFKAFFRLEEIYSHLIRRFPGCCPLSEQEQGETLNPPQPPWPTPPPPPNPRGHPSPPPPNPTPISYPHSSRRRKERVCAGWMVRGVGSAPMQSPNAEPQCRAPMSALMRAPIGQLMTI